MEPRPGEGQWRDFVTKPTRLYLVVLVGMVSGLESCGERKYNVHFAAVAPGAIGSNDSSFQRVEDLPAKGAVMNMPQNGTQALAPGRARSRKLPAWSAALPRFGVSSPNGTEKQQPTCEH